MKVTGLSGKSGTGKSYAATKLSADLGVDVIIDDGLYIYNGNIVAGKSAKRQKTKIGAVKTAVFVDEEQLEDVKTAIKISCPEHVLILGTSDEMVGLIAERLNLPTPENIIHIEDITSEKDREIAKKRRETDGMHTIPAPTLEVKKQFSGYFIDPKRSFKSGSDPKQKTVIRPTYSYLGSYKISDRVIEQIVDHVVSITAGCSQLLFATFDNSDEGLYIRAIINVERGCKIMEAAALLQKRVTLAVAHMTSFNVLGVEVEIRGYGR